MGPKHLLQVFLAVLVLAGAGLLYEWLLLKTKSTLNLQDISVHALAVAVDGVVFVALEHC